MDSDLTALEKMLRVSLNLILHLNGVLFSFVLWSRLNQNDSLNCNSMWVFFEKNNFIIYLLHQQVIQSVIFVLNGKLHPSILAFLNFVISLVISSVLCIIINLVKARFVRK